MERTLFERIVDLEGRLRLPTFLFDQYERCYISFGLFSRHYLQLTPNGVYHLIEKEFNSRNILDRESFDLQSRFHVGEHLKMDSTGRIKIPDILRERSHIHKGGRIIGQAGPTVKDHDGWAYWTIWSKEDWLRSNPRGELTLDSLNASF